MGGKAVTNTNIPHCNDLDGSSFGKAHGRIEGEIQSRVRGVAILCGRWRDHTRHEARQSRPTAETSVPGEDSE